MTFPQGRLRTADVTARHGGPPWQAESRHPLARGHHRTSNLSRVIWIVWTLVTGGSVAGWMAPGIPLVGPLVQQLLGNKTVNEILSDETRQWGDRSWHRMTHGKARSALLKKKLAEQQSYRSEQSSTTKGRRCRQLPEYSPPHNPRVTPGAPVQKSPDEIGIASYNIQVFGTSKLAKSWIVDILAQVVRRLDIVAIQEVRSKDDQILPQFLAAINADGSQYDFVIGPRLGRTDSKEQYAFVFDTNRIEVDRSSVGTMSDPNDVLAPRTAGRTLSHAHQQCRLRRSRSGW